MRLINADQGYLSWPDNGSMKFGSTTQKMRENLFGKEGPSACFEAKELALAELKRIGPKGSLRHWWAFEGFTSIDCYLETDRMVLLIEGKRFENVSSGVQWYPNRNQLIRNIEAVSQACNGKNYAVLAIGEHTIEDPDNDSWIKSLPHLTDSQRHDLQVHYLGHTTWAKICEVTGIDYSQLPETVNDSIKELKEFGYIQK
jgi:hypothetical protein